MHTLMSNQQYYQALGSSSIVNKEGLNSEYAPSSPPAPQRGHREGPWSSCCAPSHSCSSAPGRTFTSTFSFYSSGAYVLFTKAFSIPVYGEVSSCTFF